MATLSRSWDTETTIINAASVTTGTDSSTVVLDVYEAAHVTVDADFPVSPTDNLVVELYASTNDGTDFDDTPVWTQEIDNGTDPNQISFTVPGFRSFKLTVKRSGSTDTITVTAISRRWRWSSA